MPRTGRSSAHGQWRLFGPALLVWASTAALVHQPGAARLLAVVLMCGGLAICVAVVRRLTKGIRGTRVLGLGFLTIALLLLVCARIDLTERARDVPLLTSAAERAEAVSMRVEVASYPVTVEGFTGEPRSWVRANLVVIDGERLPVAVTAMLWLPRLAPEDWAPGVNADMNGVLMRAPPESPAGFEVQVRDFSDTPSAERSSILASVGSFAAGLRVELRDAASEVPGAELVPGFAIGDTALVSDELDELMKASSLTHLVAVSGSNTGLVITFFMAVAARIGAGRRVRIVIAACALSLFVIFVGPDASVQRAAIMAVVLLVSGFGGKRGSALPSLGLAVLTLLTINPWQAVQAGFALSVVATAGILLFATQCESWLRTRLHLPKVLALPVAVACVAQFAVAPLLLLLQPGLPMGGVLANVLAAPAAPLGTGLGLVALTLLPIMPSVGELVLYFATWPARWVEAAGELAVSLPWSRWYWPGGWGAALLLAAVEALALIAFMLAAGRIEGKSGTAIPMRRPWGAISVASPRLQMLLRIVTGTVAGVLTAMVIVVPATVKLGVPKDWAVVMCDVGQGDAILLRHPERPSHTILVDTGDDEAMLEACLDLFGVQEISLLVLTHDDRDHVGAVSVALKRSHEVLISPAAANHTKSRPLIEELEAAAVAWRVGEAGMQGSDLNPDALSAGIGLTWQLLAPTGGVTPETTNAASLVLTADFGGQRILLLGDTGEKEQRALLREYPALSADIVKVAHHGSSDQAPGIYEEIAASFGLISVGGENRYGHPNPGVIESLIGAGTEALRTDELGSVALRLRDGDLEPWVAGARSSVSVVGSR